MRKFLISSLAITLACGIGFGQENSATKSENAKTVEQINYSESTPYLPFRFERPEVKNNKKDKSDKSSDNNQQTAANGTTTAIANGNTAPVGEKAFKIPVSVFNQNGIPVQNLTKANFKVFINGVEQEISGFEIEAEQPINVFLILDVSGSTSNSIDDIKHFANELTMALKPEDKVQIIKFDDSVKFLSELTNDRKLIEKAIRKLDDGYGTALYDAIPGILQKNINAVAGRKAVLLLSDGVDTSSYKQDYESSLVTAEKSDLPFYIFYLDTYEYISKIPINIKPSAPPLVYPGAIPPRRSGINSPPKGFSKPDFEKGKQYLLDLVWLSGGKAFQITRISELKKADFDNVPTVIKPQYTIGITLPNTLRAERRQVKVRVNRANLKIQARGSLIVGGDK